MPDVNLTSPSLHTPIGVGGKERTEGEGEEEREGRGRGGEREERREERGEGGGEEERDDTSPHTHIYFFYHKIINMATIICSLNKMRNISSKKKHYKLTVWPTAL